MSKWNYERVRASVSDYHSQRNAQRSAAYMETRFKAVNDMLTAVQVSAELTSRQLSVRACLPICRVLKAKA